METPENSRTMGCSLRKDSSGKAGRATYSSGVQMIPSRVPNARYGAEGFDVFPVSFWSLVCSFPTVLLFLTVGMEMFMSLCVKSMLLLSWYHGHRVKIIASRRLWFETVGMFLGLFLLMCISLGVDITCLQAPR